MSDPCGTDDHVAKKHPRRRLSPLAARDTEAPRYWHAGMKGRSVGEVLIPIAQQQSAWAKMIRHSVTMARATTSDPDLASGRIYDINKLYVTSDRSFAEAWSVLVPAAEVRSKMGMFGVQAGAFYGVELLDANGNPLQISPEPDPDYPLGGSFQVDRARVVTIHRPHMSTTAARIHFERMAGRPSTEPT